MQKSTWGNYYWFLSGPDFECHIHADRLEIDANGNAIFYVKRNDGELIYTVIKGNKWDYINAASQIDGTSVNIEHWKRKGTVRNLRELRELKEADHARN